MSDDQVTGADPLRTTLDHLSDLHKAVSAFCPRFRGLGDGAEKASAALALASALRPFDGQWVAALKLDERTAVRRLRSVFSGMVERWGWQEVAGDGGGRFVEETRKNYEKLGKLHDGLHGRYLKAALTAAEGLSHLGKGIPLCIKQPAEAGEEKGMPLSVEADEAEACELRKKTLRAIREYRDLREKLLSAIISKRGPDWTAKEAKAIAQARGKVGEAVVSLKARLGLPLFVPAPAMSSETEAFHRKRGKDASESIAGLNDPLFIASADQRRLSEIPGEIADHERVLGDIRFTLAYHGLSPDWIVTAGDPGGPTPARQAGADGNPPHAPELVPMVEARNGIEGGEIRKAIVSAGSDEPDPNLFEVFPGRLVINKATKTVTLDGHDFIIKHTATFRLYLKVAESKGGKVDSEAIHKIPGCTGRIDLLLRRHLLKVSKELRQTIVGSTNGTYTITLPPTSLPRKPTKKVRKRA